MKIKGLDYDTVVGIMKGLDPAMNWNVAGGPGVGSVGEVEGFPSYKAAAKTPWRVKVNGEWHNKPCHHMLHNLSMACLSAGASKVFVEKIGYTKSHGFSSFQKLEAKVKAKGWVCECPSVAVVKPQSQPTPTIATLPLNWHCKNTNTDFVIGQCGKATVSTSKAPHYNLKCPHCGKHGWAHEASKGGSQYHQVVQGSEGTVTLTTPTAKPVAEPTKALMVPALDGEPMDDGEVTSYRAVKGHVRPTMAVVTSLYILQELSYHLDAAVTYPMVKVGNGWRQDRSRVTKVRGEDPENYNVGLRLFWHEFTTFKAEFERRLARNMFDYLVIASAEESAYHRTVKGWSGKAIGKDSIVSFDPRTSLPRLEAIFNLKGWSTAYGGPKWANIAKSAGYWFKFRQFPVAYADHVVDLSHNTTLAWNKGYIMDMPSSTSAYMAMLDQKRNGSLLGWTGHTLEVTEEVAGLIARAMSYLKSEGKWVEGPDGYEWVETLPGIRLTAKLSVVQDHKVPTIKWGAEEFIPQSAPGTKVETIEQKGESILEAYKPKVKGEQEAYPEPRVA